MRPRSTKRKQIVDLTEEPRAKRQHLVTPSPTPSAHQGPTHAPPTRTPALPDDEQQVTPSQLVSTFAYSDLDCGRRSVPSPCIPRPDRLRSNSPDNALALEMIHGDNELLTEKDISKSSLVWIQANAIHEPRDPLNLGLKCHNMRSAEPTISKLHRINRAWRHARAEAEKPGGKPLTQEMCNAWKENHERGMLQYVSEQRRIQTDPAGVEVLLNPTSTSLDFCKIMGKDIASGWRFPGGFNPAVHPRSVHTTFQHQMLGFRRDLFDNGFAYAGCYPLGYYIAEKMGREEEIVFDIAGRRFCEVRGRVREGAHKYVRPDEVAWVEVAANGGLGDLVVFEDEENGKQEQRADAGQEEKRLREPWAARRTRFDELMCEARH